MKAGIRELTYDIEVVAPESHAFSIYTARLQAFQLLSWLVRLVEFLAADLTI